MLETISGTDRYRRLHTVPVGSVPVLAPSPVTVPSLVGSASVRTPAHNLLSNEGPDFEQDPSLFAMPWKGRSDRQNSYAPSPQSQPRPLAERSSFDPRHLASHVATSAPSAASSSSSLPSSSSTGSTSVSRLGMPLDADLKREECAWCRVMERQLQLLRPHFTHHCRDLGPKAENGDTRAQQILTRLVTLGLFYNPTPRGFHRPNGW
jgi:hypothetical protein